LKVLFLTSVEHPIVKIEAEYLSRELDLTYMPVPVLNKKQILYAFKCLIKHLPHICLSLIKLRPPLLPQVIYYLLLFSVISEDKKIINKKFDLIYAHWLFPAGFLGLMLSNIWKSKVISVIRGYDIQVLREVKNYGIHGIKRVISRFVIEKSDLVIVVHKNYKMIAQQISKQKAHRKILYIPLSVPDISLNIQGDLTEELREKLTPIINQSEMKVVLYGPSLNRLYGVREFLKAVQKVSNSVKNSVFLIVGEGELKNEAIKFIKEAGLENRVFLLGKVNYESMKILYKISTLVCDLAYPGTGTMTLEAFCFGKPVIGIKTPKSVIIHGKNGFLVEKNDYENLAIYMEAILKDYRLWKDLSKEARLAYEKHFNLEKNIRDLLKIFNSVVNQEPKY
jgi:rhamnosyl/mannosyltransferase